MSIYLKVLIGVLIFAAGSLPGVINTHLKASEYDSRAKFFGCVSFEDTAKENGLTRLYGCPDGSTVVIL